MITGTEAYDCGRDAEEVAKERKQIVVYPTENQLQIDIDRLDQVAEVLNRLDFFCDDQPGEYNVRAYQSKTAGHLHLYITFTEVKFDERDRQLWQAALGDDPKRVYLNFRRYLWGDESPSRLFENRDWQNHEVTLDNFLKLE